MESNWEQNQPVWILEKVPGFFHYWRDSFKGRRAEVGFVTPWNEVKTASVPEEWLTERKAE